jgi:hypothetical protein
MKRGIRRLSLAVLILMLAITVVGALAARAAVKDQEAILLHERTNEIGLVLTSDIGALPGPLDVLGGVLRATHNSAAAFRQASAAAAVGSAQPVTFALIRKTSAGFVVVLANGAGLHRGQLITDQRAVAFQRALSTTQLVPTAVIGSGTSRALGFVVGPPVAPAGTVLYRQDTIGPVAAPRQSATAPFSELDVMIYASPHPQASQLLAETSSSLPRNGPVRTQPLAAGAATWTLQTAAVHPLVGATTEDAPLIVVIGGIVLAVLVALVIDVETRRRKGAVELYDTEHRVAETLQRSLLPVLPLMSGLDLAARYLPGAAHQEIGGDWFDVFELGNGRVGVVIGDVVGHDIAAAAAMAKIQASLRAYAWAGSGPAAVLDRLDGLISTYAISELATVFYGVLDPADDLGNRSMTFANAGHPSPLIRHPDGNVGDVTAARSVLLGAPSQPGATRSQATVTLTAGSTLMFFTDGLVEIPGESLTDSLAQLRDTLTAAPADVGAEALCELVLAHVDPQRLRDDVAVLAVQIGTVQPERPRPDDAAAVDVAAAI